MQNETSQGHKIDKISCLKQGSEINDFFLKQGQGLKNSAAHLYSNFPWVSLPPGYILVNQLAGRRVAYEQALHIFLVRLSRDVSRLLKKGSLMAG